MTLRARITIIAAAAVALAVIVASLGLYVATARTLRGTVDQALVEIAASERPAVTGPDYRGGIRIGRFGGAGATVQVVTAAGVVLTPSAPGQRVEPLPVSDTTLAVAAGRAGAYFTTVEIDADPVRILTVPARDGIALQLARPLGEVEAILDDLQQQLVIAGLLGVALAAALGAVVARRAVHPVGELTRLAEEVAATQDLTRRLAVERQGDEIGRLAVAFDGMLAQLEQARDAQEQLIADASHELRTPLTSLRTNIEVLAHLEALSPTDRQQLLDDVVAQIDGFSQLIGGLVELARGDQPVQAPTSVELGPLAEEVAARLDPGGSRVRVIVAADAGAVVGEPYRLDRAIGNLVENALKYSPDGPVEVTVGPGTVVVRDHGPGVPPEDRPRIFDRFARSSTARGAPGSGLGLAIVRQVARSHGGDVEVDDAADGGAVFTLRLPTSRPQR